MTAKMQVKAVKIDPSLMKADECEILEDLLVTAHNDAQRKAEAAMQEKMQALTGGLGHSGGVFPLDEASQSSWGKPYRTIGEGGSIPVMAMLGERYPRAQFMVTGVMGPGSNAHGPQ